MESRKNNTSLRVFLFVFIFLFSSFYVFAQNLPQTNKPVGGRVHWVYDGSFCLGQGGLPPFKIVTPQGIEEGPYAYTGLQLYQYYMPFIPNIWAIFNAGRTMLPICAKPTAEPPYVEPVWVYPVTLPGIGSSLIP